MSDSLINRKKLSPSTLDALATLEASLPEYAARPSLGMAYGRENKYVTWKFDPAEHKTIELLHITDVQFGHVECKVDRVKEYRDWVLSKPNRFVLFGGDMIDAANVLSPGQPWDNLCGPQSQVYQFCELMAPLRARILGYVGGNHERRGLKTFGDIGLMIAYLLKIPYSSGQQLIDVHFGKHKPFKVHLYHGRGAARTKGAKVMMLHQLMKDYPGSQLYLVGHLHDCFILPTVVWERIPGRNDIKMQKVVGGMSSSFLNFWGTYAEVAGMSANDVLMLRTILEPNGHFEMTIR
jgi:hypothetical protein